MYRGRFVPGARADDIEAAPPPAEPNAQGASESLIRPRVADSAAPRSCAQNYRLGRDSTLAAPRGLGRPLACILVADFPVAAIVRANPELRDQPIALTRMPAPRLSASHRAAPRASLYQPHSELSHVAAVAQAAGVHAGMTVAQARALMPQLSVMHPSSAAEHAVADALADVAESITPTIEAGEPGCVWLDLSGLRHLYGRVRDASEEDREQAIAEEIARRVHRIGLAAAVGVGANKEIAWLAARCGGIRIIPAGREREFLDWMPLELADLGAGLSGGDLELRLKRLGLRRLGDLARLEAGAVGSRLGEVGVRLARLARGEGSATLNVRPRAESFAEAVELEYGIENLEPLSFVLQAMLARLIERLKLRGLIAGDLTLSLGLANRRRDERRVAVAAATSEVRALLALLNLSLEAAAPAAAIETIRLTVEPRVSRPAQHDLFIPPSPAPDRLEAAVARIAALCGPDRVGTILPADSYRPEAVRLGAFAPPPASGNSYKSSPAGAPERAETEVNVVRMVLRTIRPAEEIEVMLARETPEFVRGKTLCARVISVAGPWRRQGEWWAAGPGAGWQTHAPAAYARDYYELALADGGVYQAYRDIHSAKWFVDGVYD
jgi:protein ImuB